MHLLYYITQYQINLGHTYLFVFIESEKRLQQLSLLALCTHFYFMLKDIKCYSYCHHWFLKYYLQYHTVIHILFSNCFIAFIRLKKTLEFYF